MSEEFRALEEKYNEFLAKLPNMIAAKDKDGLEEEKDALTSMAFKLMYQPK